MRSSSRDIQTCQLGREPRKPLVPTVGVAALDEEIVPFDPAELTELLKEWCKHLVIGGGPKEADATDRQRRLSLRGARCGERRQNNAAKEHPSADHV